MVLGTIGCLVAVCASAARADVKLAPVLGHHAVLQRNQVVPVWGQARPRERVTIAFRKQQKTVTADDQGRWMVKLDPLVAGGPDKLTVSAGNVVEIDDVLVGEVWMASGQSNVVLGVGWALAQKDAGMAALVASGPYPQIRQFSVTTDARWHSAQGPDLNLFPGIPFAFAVRLHKALGVPIGIIAGAVSGSASSCWLSKDALNADVACQDAIRRYASSPAYAKDLERHGAAMDAWKKSAAKARAEGKPEPQPLRPLPRPGEGADGGVGCLYNACVRPVMPHAIGGVLWDQGESGTALAGVDQYVLMGALIRGWRHDWGQGEFPFIYVQKPSGYGCGWDPANPVTRNAEPFAPLPQRPADDGSGELIGEKIRIMQHANTGMAISSDLGSGTHPTNKSGYGHRAAGVALGMVYGSEIEYYGPIYDSHSVEGANVRVTFRHVGQGLANRHGNRLQGFALAGADNVFHWAEARIDGKTIVVSSARVPKPLTVRYAWTAYRPWANLFNKDGLPAVPFSSKR
jgi:sialate O-acetylesterase